MKKIFIIMLLVIFISTNIIKYEYVASEDELPGLTTKENPSN